jgi:hypothetical protein
VEVRETHEPETAAAGSVCYVADRRHWSFGLPSSLVIRDSLFTQSGESPMALFNEG